MPALRAMFCSVANCVRKSARRKESRAVPVPGLPSVSSSVGDVGVGFVFALGGGLLVGPALDDGEVNRKSCGCVEGVVGRGISAGFVGTRMGAGAGAGGGFESGPRRMGRSERAGMGIVSVIQLSGPGPSIGLCAAVGVSRFDVIAGAVGGARP